jgi:2-polyprenyl-3-methyl-5-hydroxy-6-metoxy-1,4-benzoquinol methylase
MLTEDDNKLMCSECNRTYPIRHGIPDFRDEDDYWCNVSREKMRHLNRRAEETGDWLNSAREIIPEYAAHSIPFCRADSQFLWPTNKDSTVLDAGSMWGGLAIPAAQFHREVYAVDKTIETLEFMSIRAKQMGLSNIYAVASSLQRLPFRDNYFDLVVLNGVLEWVAFDQDVVLEKHWEGCDFSPSNYCELHHQKEKKHRISNICLFPDKTQRIN